MRQFPSLALNFVMTTANKRLVGGGTHFLIPCSSVHDCGVKIRNFRRNLRKVFCYKKPLMYSRGQSPLFLCRKIVVDAVFVATQ